MPNSNQLGPVERQTRSASSWNRLADGTCQGAWWVPTASTARSTTDRIECTLCPRRCSLKPGDKGFCFVRENRDGEMVLSTYGRSTGFCIDPIEKKPLNHFFPGTPVLSFGTAGCNLGCKFCQNWDISKSREVERLSSIAEPESIAQAALQHGCTSVAYTYNDPIIWAEYAIDTARQCRQVGVQNVAVTAAYIEPDARQKFFEYMDAANIDLKAFTEEFYSKVTYSHLEPVLDTLRYLKRETNVWFELTNLIIPDANDDPGELRKMCGWILKNLGDQVPIHFTAFHPDFRMMDRPRTSPETLAAAQDIANSEGIQYAYVGNVHDRKRQSTRCHACGELLIDRNWYELGAYHIEPSPTQPASEASAPQDAGGYCRFCQVQIPGRFGSSRGTWGSKRQPIQIPQIPRSAEPFNDTSVDREVAGSGPNPANQANSKQLYRIQLPPNFSEIPRQGVATLPKDLSVSSTPTDPTNPTAATPQPSKPPTLLNLDRIGEEQKEKACQFATDWLVGTVLGKQPEIPPRESLGDFAEAIVMGAFVTVKRGDVLRGCCGVLGKPMTLGAAIGSAAAKTAKEDQRMAAVSASELPYLDLDVTLLGPFQKVNAQGSERINAIEIGKHGLMIRRGEQSGLLLPSVATERRWDAEQFLHAVCQKAGLPISAWEHADTQLFTFDGTPMGAPMKKYLPEKLNSFVPSVLNGDVLNSYTRIVGQNIVAFCSGGTPSYVIPELPDATVNGVVLSLQWYADGEKKDLQQGNLVQVSFRPGVPLQSTLYQMSQQAAQMFRVRGFSGHLQVGITVGIDPAMHGYGMKADLEGINTIDRGLVISDPRHCGLAFNPEEDAETLREKLRELLPISSRDASVHSMQIVSTMPRIISVSGPQPALSSGQRPPAVAGKFYPGEDAARRAVVGTLFKDEAPDQLDPLAIMVPHAGIKYSGKTAAKAWWSVENLGKKPIIVISPKHTADGVNWSACPFDSWRLSNTTSIQGNPELAKQIAEAVTPIQLDAGAHQKEHGIEVQLPILERLAPDAQVVGLALNGGSIEDIKDAAAEFAEFLKSLPELPLLVISSDMNHYAPEAENQRRDRLALDAMATGDPDKLVDTCRDHEISMCGVVPAAFVMETLHQLGKPFRVEEVAYTTSAEVSGDKSQVVGYAGSLLVDA